MRLLLCAAVAFYAFATTAVAQQQSPHCGQNSGGNVTTCMACIARTQPGKFTPKQTQFWCTNRIAELRAQGHFK